jgi:hypothetical protein
MVASVRTYSGQSLVETFDGLGFKIDDSLMYRVWEFAAVPTVEVEDALRLRGRPAMIRTELDQLCFGVLSKYTIIGWEWRI